MNAGAGLSITAPSNEVFDNVISGNAGSGVQIIGYWATNNVLQGNLIGTDENGTALGNGQHGVMISASDSVIGGFEFRRGTSVNYAANVIAHNGGDGVYVASGVSNTIRGNSPFTSAGLGIDLDPDGVTKNDILDGDMGPNNLQNFPSLKFAFKTTNGTTVRMIFTGELLQTFHIDFYVSDQEDPSGNGEGQTFLASHALTTSPDPHPVVVDVTLPDVPAGKFITATATDSYGNTSEFGNAVRVRQARARQR